MEDRIGVFICTGYGIKDALDIEALSKVATDEFKVTFCTTIEVCDKSALEKVNLQIADEKLNKVVIAGISPRRYKFDDFPEEVIVEKVAILEHVVWTQPAGIDDTQMLA